MGLIKIGDCLELIKDLEDNSVDAVVTDPPAGIGFMNKEWDSNKGGRTNWVQWLTEVMDECLRVLKPGGHMLVWALPRTSHWTATAIENAGFEIRDRLAHFFGTGFPKSHDVSKAIDKMAGAKRVVIGDNPNHRAVSGVGYEGIYAGGNTGAAHITAPATPEAKKWDGFGTALKPACEDWWLARKPIEGTIAANVLEWGTGVLNIEGCRIKTEDKLTRKLNPNTESDSGWKSVNRSPIAGKDGGRWPANVTLDETAAKMLQASKFFYVAKPSKKERGEGNTHPTVKSIALMRWLVRLITPPRGVVLDPFAGSGTTGIACQKEGFRFIGFEANEEYAQIARRRLEK